MEPKEILELVRAGFTKQDIALMISPLASDPEAVQTSAAEPAAEPAAAAEAVPAAQPPAQPQTQPAAQPEQPSTADIMKEIARLTSAVQANAIANSTLPQGISNPVKAEDVVAQIIRPTYPERGK